MRSKKPAPSDQPSRPMVCPIHVYSGRFGTGRRTAILAEGGQRIGSLKIRRHLFSRPERRGAAWTMSRDVRGMTFGAGASVRPPPDAAQGSGGGAAWNNGPTDAGGAMFSTKVQVSLVRCRIRRQPCWACWWCGRPLRRSLTGAGWARVWTCSFPPNSSRP